MNLKSILPFEPLNKNKSIFNIIILLNTCIYFFITKIKQKIITMVAVGGEQGGAKVGSLRLVVSPLGFFGPTVVLICCSHALDELTCLLLGNLVD